jgi:hypothetical protein
MVLPQAEHTTSSERLMEMLNNSPHWKNEKKGLCQQIYNAFNEEYSYATVRKWLYDNSLPNTPEKRKYVANTLHVDLFYWEYGVYTDSIVSVSVTAETTEPLTYLNHSNAVHIAMKNKGVVLNEDLTEQSLIQIQELSINHSIKHNRTEPDKALINGILDIVKDISALR